MATLLPQTLPIETIRPCLTIANKIAGVLFKMKVILNPKVTVKMLEGLSLMKMPKEFIETKTKAKEVIYRMLQIQVRFESKFS